MTFYCCSACCSVWSSADADSAGPALTSLCWHTLPQARNQRCRESGQRGATAAYRACLLMIHTGVCHADYKLRHATQLSSSSFICFPVLCGPRTTAWCCVCASIHPVCPVQVETEQLVEAGIDPKTGQPMISAHVQLRGSVPLFWSQQLGYSPKPDIILQHYDPLYQVRAMGHVTWPKQCGGKKSELGGLHLHSMCHMEGKCVIWRIKCHSRLCCMLAQLVVRRVLGTCA